MQDLTYKELDILAESLTQMESREKDPKKRKRISDLANKVVKAQASA